ncbi:hypothetical protein KI387_014788 [Taxus chinensis]|uniref:SPX domain-containing protein n=1 Tax=Taxus chinensis TaxID=29808 RepID=A0AA38FI39_TAXCH|nr:hypothetical protein KI387_014788 [Taxus chinensis]
MKFGKNLRSMIEEAPPDWRDKFLSYKHLKKRLKLLAPGVEQMEAKAEADAEREGEAESDVKQASEGRRKRRRIETQQLGEGRNGSFNYNLTVDEADFIQLLNPELEKFNLFFMEKEEEYVIRQKEVQERIARVKETYGPTGICPSKVNYEHDMTNVRKDIVNFHGEMVLLENYSVLNYTEEEEGDVHLFARQEEDIVYVGEDQEMYKSTVAALRSMREMRKGSSTYTALSLPPLHDNPSTSTLFSPPIFPQG